MQSVIDQVQKIVGDNAGHGIDHILNVLTNVRKMVDSVNNLSIEQMVILDLAALLHDVDDHKFFEGTSNAKTILQSIPCYKDIVDVVLFCIDCVGYSSNQNKYPISVPTIFDLYKFNREFFDQTGTFHDNDMWILYPRFADRLEAIDLERALEFGRSRKRKDFDENTPRIKYMNDFEKIDFDMLERNYIQRGCKAHPEHNTSMDHVYEKCMNLVKMETKNKWCESEKLLRHEKLKTDIMNFWNQI